MRFKNVRTCYIENLPILTTLPSDVVTLSLESHVGRFLFSELPILQNIEEDMLREDAGCEASCWDRLHKLRQTASNFCNS